MIVKKVKGEKEGDSECLSGDVEGREGDEGMVILICLP